MQIANYKHNMPLSFHFMQGAQRFNDHLNHRANLYNDVPLNDPSPRYCCALWPLLAAFIVNMSYGFYAKLKKN